MKLAILLTATVKVQARGGQFTTEERAEMYASTLRYYAQEIGGGKNSYTIIFCENSDYDLSEFKQEFNSQLDIEWIQLRPDSGVPFEPKKGKGYNEYLMIKEAVLRSGKLKNYTHFMKITGRYAMRNICSVIKEVERRCEDKVFLDDVKDTQIYDIIGRKNTDSGHWADSRYFVANVNYYKEKLLDLYKQMDDFVYKHDAESTLYKLYQEHKEDSQFLFRFRTQIQFDGQCGHISESFTEVYNSPKARLKNKIRQLLRILFPNIMF